MSTPVQSRHNSICSRASHVSETLTVSATPVLAGNLFSQPSSPYSSASSFVSFRPKHSALPRLHIPEDASKMVVQTRGSRKRKYESEDRQSPEVVGKSRKLNQKDAGVQVGSSPDAAIWEAKAAFDSEQAAMFQEIAEYREHMLELTAKVAKADGERRSLIEENHQLKQRQSDIETRLQRFEDLIREYKIPKDRWP